MLIANRLVKLGSSTTRRTWSMGARHAGLVGDTSTIIQTRFTATILPDSALTKHTHIRQMSAVATHVVISKQKRAILAKHAQGTREMQKVLEKRGHFLPVLALLDSFPDLEELKRAAFHNGNEENQNHLDYVVLESFTSVYTFVRNVTRSQVVHLCITLSDMIQAIGPDDSIDRLLANANRVCSSSSSNTTAALCRKSILADIEAMQEQLTLTLQHLFHVMVEDAHAHHPFMVEKKREILLIVRDLLDTNKHFLFHMESTLEHSQLETLQIGFQLESRHVSGREEVEEESNSNRLEHYSATYMRAHEKIAEFLADFDRVPRGGYGYS